MTPNWRIAKGERIYAIGDIHGCADLFAALMSLIRRDNASRPQARTRIIILGDVVDRGPDSKALVDRLVKYSGSSKRFSVLKGNHEQTMLAALSGDLAAAEMWIKFGGDATLISWGVESDLIEKASTPVIMFRARQCIPPDVLQWMRRLRLYIQSGNVLFVHAGLRSGVPLRKQDPQDLMWIRHESIDDTIHHPLLVVHGHTIWEDGPHVQANHIGIDTGAYRTGRLTALGFEGGSVWSLATR